MPSTRNPPSSPKSRAKTASQVLALYVIAGGIVSFSGWVLDIPRLTGWDGSGISIQPNATLAATAAGLALLCLTLGSARAALALGAFVALIGAATVFQYISGVELGIDSLLMFDRPWGRKGVLFPGRMGPPGATSWSLIGGALMLAATPGLVGGRHTRALAAALAVATTAIASLSIIGYGYGADRFYGIPTLTVIAFQTSTFVLAISVGLILAIPDYGPTRLLAQQGPAGTLVRRVLPGLILVPIVLGLVRLAGQQAGLYDLAFGTAASTLVEIAILLMMLWWTARAISEQSSRRERAEGERRKQAQELRTVLESISDGLITLDAHWRYAYVNPEAERLLRTPARDLLGKIIWNVFPDVVGTPFERELRAAAGSGQKVHFESFFAPANGWYASTVFPTTDGGVSVYFQDVTARIAAEAEVRRSREELERDLADSLLLQELSAGIVHDNEVESMYGRIIETARSVTRAQFATMQIAEPGSAWGRTGLRLVAASGLSAKAAEHWHWITEASTTACGKVLSRAERVWVADVSTCDFIDGTADQLVFEAEGIQAVQSTPLVARNGAVLGVLSTHWRERRDPSARDMRLLDLIARQAADLVERWKYEHSLRDADRRKDQFLMTLAHELRNPLAPIRSSTELLKRLDISDPAVTRARDVIDRQTTVMAHLLDDLMDVGRIARDKLDLRLERVDLAAVIQNAVEMSTPFLERFEHQLHLRLPSEPTYLQADPLRLGQLIGNLLNNACRYTEPRGQIWLSADREGQEVVVGITDTGIGIPQDQLESIFTMFSQVDSSLERSRGGLGIGLHLARRLAEMHGGRIDATSAGPGRGSTFTLRLPVIETTTEVTPGGQGQEGAADPLPLRILVVEDNIDGAEMLAVLLETNKHVVKLAHDGPGALAVAESFRPDVVLLDIGLPLMNGFDVCRAIRLSTWAKDVVIVALTGWGQDSDQARSRAAGFDHHLVKPVVHEALLNLLKAVSPKPAAPSG